MHSTRCFPSRLRSRVRAERSKSAYGRNVCMSRRTRSARSYVGAMSARGGALGVVGVVGADPGHQLAQLPAGLLDRVLLTLGAQRLELGSSGVLVVDEPLRERAAPD